MVVEGRKGKTIPRAYREFLVDTYDDMQGAIADMENLQFHHAPHETEEWKCYNRMCQWVDEFYERIEWYDDVKEKGASGAYRIREETKESLRVVQPHDKRDEGVGESAWREPDEPDFGHGEEGYDDSQDPNSRENLEYRERQRGYTDQSRTDDGERRRDSGGSFPIRD